MNLSQLRSRCKPHLWFQLYWVVYLVWFFWLDLTIKDPKYIIHSPLDDSIPFNEWFVFPYCSWFLLLAGVTALLWWYDTASYDKLCLSMFAGMTFCLIVYMVLPNGLDIRPTAEAVGRSNIAMRIMQLLCTAALTMAILSPIKEIDFDIYALETARLREAEAAINESAERIDDRLNRAVIEEQCEEYILDKAEELGANVSGVNVQAQWSLEGIWVPYSAEIDAPDIGSAKAALESVIENELGIPAERQMWM